ncbi:MAG: tripartite tricarboxylate transporter substrate binding protein, partial [Proteobacteria bacterium]|nr:tripartite tricarboxylate transporter substrate binding protein [Pseudomonadota bacterium]
MATLFQKTVIAAAALLCAHTHAWSQGAYPSRPVKVIVAFPPGQATDQAARAISQKLSENLGQQFFVENKPGAASIIGSEA